MSTPRGWLGLLLDLVPQFESLAESPVTLHLYVAPTRGFLFSGFPQVNGDMGLNSHVVAEGVGSCDAVSPTFTWWCLFANPQAPNQSYLAHVVFPKRDQFTKLAQEAWTLLPEHLRVLARGAKDSTGWMFVVYRVLKRVRKE